MTMGEKTSDGRGGPALMVDGLWKSFSDSVVLRGISFALGQQEILGVIGPSGSGKTTLLRCLNLLEVPDRGALEYPGVVRFLSSDVECQSITARSPSLGSRPQIALRRHVGMVFQSLNLWEEKTVLENLTLAPRVVLKMTTDEAENDALRLCTHFGLQERFHARVWSLSGGEKQRVAIVRALLMRPKVLLLDEITSALDPVLIVNVMALIRELRETGLAMVIVTHHIEFAASLCDRLMFLEGGVVVQIGSPNAVRAKPASDGVRSFLEILEKAR